MSSEIAADAAPSPGAGGLPKVALAAADGAGSKSTCTART